MKPSKHTVDDGFFRELAAKGFTADQMSIILQVPRRIVTSYAGNNAVRLTHGLTGGQTQRIYVSVATTSRTIPQIAENIGVDPKAVHAKCLANGWAFNVVDAPDARYLYALRRGVVVEFPFRRPPAAPSAALIRLAAFDPLFTRVLRRRLAERGESDLFSTLVPNPPQQDKEHPHEAG